MKEGRDGAMEMLKLKHILGIGNSQCKGPVAGMTETK